MKTHSSFPALAVTAACMLLQGLSAATLPADVLFQEDFENPDVPGYSQGITPDIWVRASAGYGSGDHGMTDKSGGDFSAPTGNEQAYAFRYSNSGITTKEKALGSPLAFGGGYEVSFDVVKDNSTGQRGYNVKLIAFGAGAVRNDCRSIPTGSTQLATATGNAPSDGSISTVTFTFIPNATTHAAEFGKDLGIRVIGSLSSCIIDNIRFRAIPGTGAGLNLVTTSPLDNSVNNLASSPVKAIFSKNIAAGSGNVTLRDLTNSTDTVMPVGDSRIAINGCCLDILPGPHLEWAKDYAVLIDSGAVVESPGGTPFTGIPDPTAWNFTMMGGDPLFYSISQLKSHILGTITLTAAEIDTIKKNLDTVVGRFAESSASITALLDLIYTYDTGTISGRKGPLWVSTTFPQRTSVTNDLRWTMFNVMQNIMDRIYTAQTLAAHESLLNGFKFASSANFPGNCATPSPANVHTATISASYLDTYGPPVIQDGPGTYARKPTGCYLAPGTIATVTVPPSLVNTGYKIRVGCHSWDFSAKPDIKRLDRVTRVYDIKGTNTKVANPLGGGIYIEVPFLANAGVVTVDITGAARSPYFSAKSFHTTTNTQWETVERGNPGPWADFQTDKFMMQVPKSWIYSMTGAQATTLMSDWDKAMDAINDLMGYTAFNPAIGPDKYIFGKETMYPQVDLLLKNAVYAPGYPSVNTTYSPTGNYNNGYAGSHLVRGPQNAPDYEFHEQGHGYLFPKFGGESESAVNLLHVAVWNRKFSKSMDEAFRTSRGYTRTYMTLDTTAVAWMCVFNFSPRKVPMADGEKAYQLKGHAKFVDIANLYGWDVLGKFWGSMVDLDNTNTPYPTDTDSLLFRLCQAVGKDIRPLFHFWGIYPANPSALAAQIAAANIPPDPAIKSRLLHYKSLVPADNAAFRAFATAWWGKQPSINGYWEEREHSRQWDQAALFGAGDQQRADITINEEYIPACAQQIRDRVQELVDLYFPSAINPNPLTFSISPAAVNATTIRMVATTANAAIGPIQYYFENITNGTNSGWISSNTWDSTGLTTGQSYSFRVKARDSETVPNETDWSNTLAATAQTDTTAPSPNPMTFATPPTSYGDTSVTMTAASASDINGVEYEFVCTAGGGHDSGWQDSPTYTDTLLNASTQYTYKVRSRDKSAAQNVTAFSNTASATTPTPDTTPPAILTLDPADNATGIPASTDMVITFNEPIGPNTGSITIKNLSDATETVIDINDDTQVTFSGATLTIVPTTGLLPVKNYAVRIDAGAVQDLSGNPFAGTPDDTTWNFTTAVVPYVWTKTTGGAQDWTVGANWQGGNSPNPIIGDTVDFSSANITAATTLTLSADRTAQLWKFGDATTASHDWTVNAGNSMILAGTTPTIEVVNRTATLNNVVTGTGGLVKSGTGSLTLNGANTYTGGTAITGGTLTVNASAASAVAGGPLTLNGSGRLTVSGTNISSTSQVMVDSGGGSISVSGNNNFTTTGKLTGSGVLTHADPGGAGARSLNFNATNNDFTGGIIIGGSNGLTFAVNSLTDSSNNIVFNNNSSGGTNGFTYGAGAIAPLTLDNRAIEINSGSNTHTTTILNNNTSQAITINTSLIATGSGAKTLTLNAVAGPNNVFAGNITNGSGGGTVALTKSGAGSWKITGNLGHGGLTTASGGNASPGGRLYLSGTNTGTGGFSVSGNGLLVFQGKQSVPANSSISLNHGGGTNNGSSMRLLDDTAGTVALTGVTINYDTTNAVGSQGIFVGNNNTANLGTSAGTTTGSTIEIENLVFRTLPSGGAGSGVTSSIVGANGYRLKINNVTLNNLTGLSGGASQIMGFNPTTANVTIGNITMAAGNTGAANDGAPILKLDGTATDNRITGDITNASDYPTSVAVSVQKTSSSTWTLSGNNSFSGGLTLSGATAGSQLNLNSATSLGTGNFTINGGNNAKLDNTSGAPVTLTTNNPQTWSNDFAFVGSNDLNLGTGAVTMGGNRSVTVTASILTVGGAISGSTFNLTKSGKGTLILGGANTYTGTTTVSAGKLFINGDQTAASGALTVNANATLGGTGIIGGATTIAANGKLEFTLSTNAASHDKLELAATKALTFSGASTLTITSTAGAAIGSYTLLTAPGGITGNAPATLNLPAGWAATVSKSGNDLVLNVTSVGAGGAPEIAVDQGGNINTGSSKAFGTVTTGSNTSLVFTINNTGTAALNLSGSPLVAVSGTNAADFTVTSLPTTPVTSGGGTTTFTVQFAPGASGARSAVLTIANDDSDEGTFTINVSGTGQTPYEAWAGGAAFDSDANGDGVKNGMAFLLGAAGPSAAVTLPTVSQASGNLTLSFDMLKPANRGTATLSVQHSRDLGIADPWTTVLATDANSGPTSGVTFTVTPGGGTTNGIQATIGSAEAGGTGKLFGRLQANP